MIFLIVHYESFPVGLSDGLVRTSSSFPPDTLRRNGNAEPATAPTNEKMKENSSNYVSLERNQRLMHSNFTFMSALTMA